MTFIKRLVQFLLVLVVLLVGVAFLLPREVEVARSTTISAPPEEVFAHVNSLAKFSEWSPWSSIDPDMKVTYSGPELGIGNKMEWQSEHPNVGNGVQEITAIVENERVESALDFGDMGTALASFDLAKAGDGTEITWGLKTDMGNNPIGRWMGLMMDRLVGGDYEKGLANLKAQIEGG